MKYDYDLALRILQTLEASIPGKSFSVDSFIDDDTEDYDMQFRIVAEHMKLLNQAGLVESAPLHVQCPGGTDYLIKEGINNASGLTIKGHQYLASVSNNNLASKISQKVKSGAIAITQALSVEAVIELGKSIIGS